MAVLFILTTIKIFRVGDDALVSIGRGCSLRNLHVSGCPLVTDVGLTAIARGCPELTYLDISVLQVRLIDMCMTACLYTSHVIACVNAKSRTSLS